MELQNKRLTNDEFYGLQKEILTQWPTGAAVNFDEAVEFHKSLPENKNFGKKLSKAKAEGKGVVSLRGKMIDAPIVARAAQVLEAAEAMKGGR